MRSSWTASLIPLLATVSFAAGAHAQSRMALTDAQIAGITAAANDGEIEQGRLAQLRAVEPAVRDFAGATVAQHDELRRSQSQLLGRILVTPVGSAQSAQIESRASGVTQQLRALDGVAFDRAYLDAQVRQYTAALSTIDALLLPSAQNPEVRSSLAESREFFAARLALAQQLRMQLDNFAGVGAGSGPDLLGYGVVGP